ncbi:hypothetical protein J3E69DRAFT_366031 [Trichoderma sp. SZMC 28015]
MPAGNGSQSPRRSSSKWLSIELFYEATAFTMSSFHQPMKSASLPTSWPIRADIGVTSMGELLLPKRLLVIDLVDLPGEHLNALIEEALSADRQRFVKYLNEQPLGLGAIMANLELYRLDRGILLL